MFWWTFLNNWIALKFYCHPDLWSDYGSRSRIQIPNPAALWNSISYRTHPDWQPRFFFFVFLSNEVCFAYTHSKTLLHLRSPRISCVAGCWNWTKVCGNLAMIIRRTKLSTKSHPMDKILSCSVCFPCGSVPNLVASSRLMVAVAGP